MSISTEETKRYFQETAIALRREGFRIEPSVGGRLGVSLVTTTSIHLPVVFSRLCGFPSGSEPSVETVEQSVEKP